MDLASVVAALASVGVRVSGSTPNNNIQGDSSRACPTGLAGPEPSGTLNDPGQHFQHSAVSGSTTRMSATISNAYRRSLRGKILAKAQAKVEARPKATTPARASRKDVVKVVKTRVKVDEEEALTASLTTRTRTRTEATPTLIQGELRALWRAVWTYHSLTNAGAARTRSQA